MHYVPIGLPFFIVLWGLFGLLVVLIQINVLQFAFETMGVSRRHMFTLLLLSLLGSYINIPVAELPAEHMRAERIVTVFGIPYVVPVLAGHPGTVIALNVGGALLPFCLSVFLIIKHRLYWQSLLAVPLVAFAVHRMAHIVPGVGVAVPILIPPLITAAVALVISGRHAGPLAYIAGSLGTLIGADLMNLDKIRGLGAPVASIGGAGKFDGIFVTGIVAVLLAGLLAPRHRDD
jgi:uncharacterized membrane protein